MEMVVFGVAMGLLALGGLWWHAERGVDRDEAWRRFARERGGTFAEGKLGAWNTEYPSVDLIVQHAVVQIDLYASGSGTNRGYCTRARARYSLGAGPIFRVAPDGPLGALMNAFGAQDVRLGGDESFDVTFVVKCDDPEWTRAAWTPEAKALMGQHFDWTVVTADREVVCLTLRGEISSPELLDAMADLVGTLASSGGRLLERYAELEDAEFTPVSGPFAGHTPPRLRFETSRGQVDMHVSTGSRGPRVSLQIAHELDISPFTVDVVDARAHGLPRDLVGERAQPLLARVGAVTIVGDDATLKLSWSDAPSPETMQDGVRLLMEFAGGQRSQGAFR